MKALKITLMLAVFCFNIFRNK